MCENVKIIIKHRISLCCFGPVDVKKYQLRPQSSTASFDVTSPVKLVGRSHLGRNKRQIQNAGARPSVQLQPKSRQPHFICKMILKCSEGIYVTYTSEIFPNPRSKKQVFRRAMSGTFSRWTGTFLSFCAGLLASALSSKPPPLTRIAGIGLGTRLKKFQKIAGDSHLANKSLLQFDRIAASCSLLQALESKVEE